MLSKTLLPPRISEWSGSLVASPEEEDFLNGFRFSLLTGVSGRREGSGRKSIPSSQFIFLRLVLDRGSILHDRYSQAVWRLQIPQGIHMPMSDVILHEFKCLSIREINIVIM